jgi:thiamine-monophosphate kinase
MAGTPVSALITIGLPKEFDPEFVLNVYFGINALAQEFGISIAGGETTLSPERIFISVSVIGTVPSSQLISRAGAKPGDAIFVTGDLGGSIAGKHLDFIPRIQEGQWLADNFKVHAMMDLSDGIAGDLRQILSLSKVGADLLSSAIPISHAAKLKAKAESSAKPPLLAALTDGEDFELLFTIASREAVPLLDAWTKKFPKTKLSCIGKITAEPGLRLSDKNGVRNLGAHGYTHFEKP